ncbi:hypothetical protein L1887_16415 [Cichorium endivia]|nr:hypothetical protein L1887_16415 [Cichorium endivia]
MEDASSSLNWKCNYQEKAHDTAELKLSLFYSKLEMETILACANEEIARKAHEASHFKNLLTKTIKERDEFRFKCQKLVSRNLILQQKFQNVEANLSSFVRATHPSYIEDDPIVRVVSSLGSHEDSAKSQLTDQIPLLSLPPSVPDIIDNMVLTKRLPEKGKFLHAMMEAGPLLQTLLLVGHLPQWRNPPPLSFTSMSDGGKLVSKKRGLEHSYEVQVHGYDSPPTTNTKNQKVVRQSPLTIL